MCNPKKAATFSHYQSRPGPACRRCVVQHTITYDDGDSFVHNLAACKWDLVGKKRAHAALDPPAAVTVGSAKKAKAAGSTGKPQTVAPKKQSADVNKMAKKKPAHVRAKAAGAAFVGGALHVPTVTAAGGGGVARGGGNLVRTSSIAAAGRGGTGTHQASAKAFSGLSDARPISLSA